MIAAYGSGVEVAVGKTSAVGEGVGVSAAVVFEQAAAEIARRIMGIHLSLVIAVFPFLFSGGNFLDHRSSCEAGGG